MCDVSWKTKTLLNHFGVAICDIFLLLSQWIRSWPKELGNTNGREDEKEESEREISVFMMVFKFGFELPVAKQWKGPALFQDL